LPRQIEDGIPESVAESTYTINGKQGTRLCVRPNFFLFSKHSLSEANATQIEDVQNLMDMCVEVLATVSDEGRISFLTVLERGQNHGMFFPGNT
jgi:hypothetical protein